MALENWLSTIETLTKLGGVAGGVGTAAYGVWKFLGIKSRHEQMVATRGVFQAVMDCLSSDNEVQQLAGAVLIRRFFNPATEVGLKGTPYAEECVQVIAGILKNPDLSPNVQKVLADSLAYAPTLRRVDLQGARLCRAYLGDRVRKGIDASEADFFESDLTEASLTGITAKETVFYHAVMPKASVRQADLRGADFREANLEGAKFDGADLDGARFHGALLTRTSFKDSRNIPPAIAKQLRDHQVP